MSNIITEKYMSSTTHIRIYNDNEIDFNKVEKLRHYIDLIEALDEWILAPDKRLLPKLQKLQKILQGMYKIKSNIKLYRGFGNSSQDTMGVSVKGIFKKTIDLNVGESFKYTNKYPLSFSTSYIIASDFGPFIVTSMLDNSQFVPIVKELCYIISKDIRNLQRIESQDEIILMPTTKKYTLIHKGE